MRLWTLQIAGHRIDRAEVLHGQVGLRDSQVEGHFEPHDQLKDRYRIERAALGNHVGVLQCAGVDTPSGREVDDFLANRAFGLGQIGTNVASCQTLWTTHRRDRRERLESRQHTMIVGGPESPSPVC